MEDEIFINCACVPSTSFNQVGETIVGDLKKNGGVVMHDLTIDPNTSTEINKMVMNDARKEGD